MMHQQNMSMTCFAHHTLSTLFVMAGHYKKGGKFDMQVLPFFHMH